MKRIISALALVYLVLTLVGCSSGTAQTQTYPTTSIHTPASKPTQPSIPSGTVLYQSDWSHGLAAWGNPPGWKIVNGMLQSDLGDNDIITLPYKSAAPNYALEVRFQIVSVPNDGGYFVVYTDQTQGKDGYDAGILNLLSPAAHNQFANPQVQVYINPTDDMESRMVTSDYEPGFGWHTYRIEVQGPTVRFLTDGLGKSSATSSVTNVLSNRPIRLESAGAIINVSSVRLMAL